MWGAIIGDIAGSTYEAEQFGNVHKVSVDKIITDKSMFTDDTILTIAILDAYLNDKDYENKIKEYANNYRGVKHPGFPDAFSQGFLRWVDGVRDNNSIGNGAMMRISSIPFLSTDYMQMLDDVKAATMTSHNTEEAISCTVVISEIIYSALNGETKEELAHRYKDYIFYKDFIEFNATCKKTLNNCLYAVFSSSSYEETIRKVISYGGDTDTDACIAGAMAESLYGAPSYLIEEARKKLPDSFIYLLDQAYERKNKKIR